MSDSETDKYEILKKEYAVLEERYRALEVNYNNYADQLEFAGNYIEKGREKKSFLELFDELKNDVIDHANLADILLFTKTDTDFKLLNMPPDKKCSFSELKTGQDEAIIKLFAEYYSTRTENIKIHKIIYEETTYYILVFIRKADKIISSNETNLIIFFNSLLVYKFYEKMILIKRIEAFQNVIAEKAMLLNENLSLQNLLASRLQSLILQLQSEGIENKHFDILTKYLDRFQYLQNTVIAQISSLGYYAELPVSCIPFSITELVNEFRDYVCISHLENQVNADNDLVEVDPELFIEALKQVDFIFKSLIETDKEKMYKIKLWEDAENRFHLFFYNENIDPDAIKNIASQEKTWNKTRKVPHISTQVLLSYRLLNKLLKANQCCLIDCAQFHDEPGSLGRGLEILITRYTTQDE